MSSYFDDLSAKVADLSHASADEVRFFEAVCDLEQKVIKTVSLATGDREFPDDLREKVQNAIAGSRLMDPGAKWSMNTMRIAPFRHLQVLREHRLFSELHRVFHLVAERRHNTRFGLLSDDPSGIVKRRDAHDAEGPWST